MPAAHAHALQNPARASSDPVAATPSASPATGRPQTVSYHADIVTQAIVNGGEAIPFASLEYERIASLIVARHVRRMREALEKAAMARPATRFPCPSACAARS